MAEETEQKIKVPGVTCTLGNGAKVRVGFNEAEPHDGYFLAFTNPEGEETRLRLSPPAYEALVRLKPHVDSWILTGQPPSARWSEVSPA